MTSLISFKTMTFTAGAQSDKSAELIAQDKRSSGNAAKRRMTCSQQLEDETLLAMLDNTGFMPNVYSVQHQANFW